MSARDLNPTAHPTAANASHAASVRFRVVVFATVMVLLMLGIAWPASVSAEHQSRLTARLTSLIGPAIDANLQVRTAVSEAHAAAVAGDDAATASAIEAAQGGMAGIDRLLSTPDLGTGATVPAAQMSALQDAQRRDLQQWSTWVRNRDPKDAAATAEGTRLLTRVRAANQALTDALRQDRSSLREETRLGSERTTQIVLVATGIALLLALLATWWTLRSLTRPILELRDAVRRQREGNRTQWARVDRGASEVRQLAADVNALTASHLELLDEQAMRLVYERAERDLTRSMRDAVGIENALFLTVENVAENLGVGHVVAIARDQQGENAQVQHWVTDEHPDCIPAAERGIREVIGRHRGMPAAVAQEGLLRVDDLRSPEGRAMLARYVDPERVSEITGSLLVAPVGLPERPIGSLVVHEENAGRRWRDAELHFLEGAADALAAYVVGEEVEAGREDYVRRLEELDRQKDTFLSTVSHELRTPLTSITGYLEMLQDGDAGELTGPQLAMLDVIERNAVRLRGLIEDILVLNRIQNAASNSTREIVDMGDVVRSAVDEFRTAADKQGVTVRSTTSEGALVLGDRGNLSRAVANIVANAVKFTPPGGDVDLVAAVDAQTRVVRVICTDTGMGIPDGEFPRISERFFRASNAATAQIPGTGLGLAIVRGIVESHGGRLTFTSTENSGTTVAMSLPGPPTA